MAKNVAGSVQKEGEGFIKGVEDKATSTIGGMTKAPTAVNIAGTATADLGGANIQDAMNITEEESKSWNPTVDYSTETRNVDQLGKTISNSATGQGLNVLMGGAYKNAGVTGTAGQRGFDTMLLQKDPNSQSEMQKLRSWGTGTLATAVGANQKKIADEGTRLKTAAEAAQTDVLGQIKSGVTDIETAGGEAAKTATTGASGTIGNIAKEYGYSLNADEPALYTTGSNAALDNLSAEQLTRINGLRTLQGLPPIVPNQGVGVNEAVLRGRLSRWKTEQDAIREDEIAAENDRQYKTAQAEAGAGGSVGMGFAGGYVPIPVAAGPVSTNYNKLLAQVQNKTDRSLSGGSSYLTTDLFKSLSPEEQARFRQQMAGGITPFTK